MRREPPGAPAHFCLKARQLFSYWSGRRGAQIGEMRVWRGWARFFIKKHGNYSKVRPPTLPNTAVIEKNQKNQKKEGGGNYRSDARGRPGELRGPGEARGRLAAHRGAPGASRWIPERFGRTPDAPGAVWEAPGCPRSGLGGPWSSPERFGRPPEPPGVPRAPLELTRVPLSSPELSRASLR